MEEAIIDWRAELQIPADWKGQPITKAKLAYAYNLAVEAKCAALQGDTRLRCKKGIQHAFLTAWLQFETDGGNGTF